MKPAFTSNRQAAAFACLLTLVLALPALIGSTGLLKRADVYPTIQWKHGPYSWAQQQIFERQGDIDILFLGASHLWNAIATPEVQSALSQQLGRDAEVITLGRPWHGFDANYAIMRDMLEHRRVRMVVIYDEGNTPHPLASRFYRCGENLDAFSALPVQERYHGYAGSVIGMPRHLLSLLRPNLLEDPARCRPNFWNEYYQAPHVALERGALRANLMRTMHGPSKNFTAYVPATDVSEADVKVHDSRVKSAFTFTKAEVSSYQAHFARQFAQMCAEHGVTVVMMHCPELAFRHEQTVVERQDWTTVLGAPVQMVGVPEARLFAGLSDAQVDQLFYDPAHLNRNGQDYFTKVITPTLLKLYADIAGTKP